ncbi:MAG: toll/interleukin-1 receptor domain-containing protein [Clostridia bacterium]|nr:toll/interleukin-1 receptor domain-containing protein [Clostridia bacterium]
MTTYEGKDKYIFVSYAHKDAETVMPILETLSEKGFRIWYDAGIEAGTEWPEYIAERLMSCSVVLVFMSTSSAASANCRKEINFALEMDKELLVVYLEKTEMSAGMRLQLNSHQALFRYRHPNDASFVRELLRSKLLLQASEGYTPDKNEGASSKAVFISSPSSAIAVGKESRYFIGNVCGYASCDMKNPWREGVYTQEVEVNAYSVIHFHGKLGKPLDRAKRATVRLSVYDEERNLVCEKTERVDCAKGSDRFSVPWTVREADGTFQTPGRYIAAVQFEDSTVYETKIELIYRQTATFGTREKPTAIEKKAQRQQHMHQQPKGLLFAIPLLVISGIIGEINSTVAGILLFAGMIFCFIALMRLTRRVVVKSFFLSLLLCTILLYFYTLYLVGVGIYQLIAACTRPRGKGTDDII